MSPLQTTTSLEAIPQAGPPVLDGKIIQVMGWKDNILIALTDRGTLYRLDLDMDRATAMMIHLEVVGEYQEIRRGMPGDYPAEPPPLELAGVTQAVMAPPLETLAPAPMLAPPRRD